MANTKPAAPVARLNQDIPFDLKSNIEMLLIQVKQKRKKRINQKDFIIELLNTGVEVQQKKL